MSINSGITVLSEQLEKNISKITSMASSGVTSFINDDLVTAILIIFVTVYMSKIRFGVPVYITNLFKNDIFRVVFLSLLLIYSFNKSPHVAIIIALVFVVTLHYIGEQEKFESIAYYDAYKNQKQ